jgi:Mg2+ and Co2+ transporter CorA
MQIDKRATASSTIDCHEIKVSKIESIRKAEAERIDSTRRNIMSFTNFLVSKQTFITRRTKREECSEQEKRAPIGLQSGQES